MKSILTKALVFSMLLGFGLSTVEAPKAQALLLVDPFLLLVAYDPDPTPEIACLILLPFCILDQKSSASTATTTADLIDDGYTQPQIQQILADQAVISKNLQSSKMALQVGPKDTRASYMNDIRKVDPQVSQTYLDWAADQANLQ